MANKLFFYLGDDEAYFRALSGEFKKHTRLNIDFQRFYESKEKNIQSFLLMVYRQKPACVFIDFSKQSQDYMHLARLLTRTPLDHKLITVGLIDYLSPEEVLHESVATGVDLTHIKSAEIFDVVYSITNLLDPKEIGPHGFATAKLKEVWEGGIPVKIGYIHADGLHFETDQKLQGGDRIKFNHHWQNNRIVPSRELFIQKVSKENMFYQFDYNVDAEFLFVDEFVPPEGMELDRIQEKRKNREDLVLYHRKQLSRWIDEHASDSLEKKAKVLVVDREFHFYDNQPRTDKHAYTIRCVPFLADIGPELDRLQPQIIAFSLENDEATNPHNTPEKLAQLVKALKRKFEGNEPFLIVFNSKLSSKEMQINLQYPHLMSSDQDLSVEVMLRMAEIFDKKLNTMTAATPQQKVKAPKRVFLKKTSAASIGEIVIPITVLKLSESDMIIQSETELPTGINIHLNKPVSMFINVQPSKTQGKEPEYHGIIHAIGEVEKKRLRQYVNAVFFREHDAKVSADSDQFKKLNELKLKEKEEALLKEQENASEGPKSEDSEN